MTTLKDLAAAAHVSVATVSNVLNSRPNVGRDVRTRVLRLATELGYSPNRAAQAMRTGRTRAIGLVLPDLTNPFFPELAQAVESTARSAGLLVCLIDSQGSAEAESDGFALLTQHAVDGVIWCPLGARVPRMSKTFARPIVLIDRARPGYGVVHSDYLLGGKLLAEYAMRMGHSRVGLLSGPAHLQSARQRRDGFVNAHPRAFDIAWEAHVDFDGVLTQEATIMLANLENVTLIVAGNDLIAMNAMRHLSDRGVKVPDEVSVTGFDNIRWSDAVTPRLTTIAQPVGAIGARAVALVQELMSGASLVNQRTIFEVSLVERDSVKCLKS